MTILINAIKAVLAILIGIMVAVVIFVAVGSNAILGLLFVAGILLAIKYLAPSNFSE